MNGDILYYNSGNLQRLPIGSNTNVLTVSGGLPSWQVSGGSLSIGSSITSATQGSVLYAGAAGVLAQDNANFFWDGTNHRLGIGTAAPINSITLSSTANGIGLYNTADQITNYEKASIQWISNVFTISTTQGGSGSSHDINIITPSSTQFYMSNSTTTSGLYQFTRGSHGGGQPETSCVGTNFSGSWQATTGINPIVQIAPTINQSSTAGYTAFLVNPTETTTGSGAKLLADFQVGGSSKANIDNTGALTASKATITTSSGILNFSGGGTSAIQQNGFTYISIGSSQVGYFTGTNQSGSSGLITSSANLNASSGVQSVYNVNPTITQTASAGYTALLVNPTESSTGSGAKLLADFQVGGTSKVQIKNTGEIVTSQSGSQINFQTGSAFISSTNGDTFYQTNFASKTFIFKDSGANTRLSIAMDTGNVTGGTYNGNTFTTGTYTLTGTAAKTLNFTNTLTLSGTDSTTITFQGTDTYVGRTTTDTLTNKRITKRVLALSTGSATPAINTDSYDVVTITAQSAAITSFTTSLTGTPVDGDTLRISITDNGTARALAWGISFEASTVALPTTTVISTRLDVGFFWNAATSKWRCVAVA